MMITLIDDDIIIMLRIIVNSIVNLIYLLIVFILLYITSMPIATHYLTFFLDLC